MNALRQIGIRLRGELGELYEAICCAEELLEEGADRLNAAVGLDRLVGRIERPADSTARDLGQSSRRLSA